MYAREQLAEGQVVRGPAIVEQYDATTYVAPGWSLHVREELLVLGRQGAA